VVRVLDTARAVTTPSEGKLALNEYLLLKKEVAEKDKRLKELYPTVMAYLDTDSYEDGKGNRVHDLDAPIAGFSRVEKVLRTSRPLDADVAEELLNSKGLRDEAYEMVEVLNEQKIMELLQDGKLTAEEVDAMFPVKESYALTPKK
jgi:hypothetical protein